MALGFPEPQDLGGPFGKYTLLKELGRGGMGVVFEAIDTELNRPVALKMLLTTVSVTPEDAAQDQERFLREARLCANLPKHPHIVGVYEAGLIHERRFIAMEYVHGRLMSAWCKEASVTLRQKLGVLRDVALAVHHAHRHGVIHRDLKPDNVLIDPANQPHVMDFGLAKRMTDSTANAGLTVQGLIVGTPAYMSPEQAEARREIDGRTDVYALGVMLFEILAGRVPFQGTSPIQVLMKTIQEPAPSPGRVAESKGLPPPDPALEQVCLKALSKKAADRYSTAGEFADDLKRWLDGAEVTAMPRRMARKIPGSTARGVAPKPAPSRARWVGAAVAGAILLGVLAIILASGGPPPETTTDYGPAEKLLSQGRAEESLRAFESILKGHPGDERAEKGIRQSRARIVAQLLDEADRLLADGKVPGALVAFGKVLAHEPDNDRARRGQREAERRLEQDKTTAAAAAVQAEKARTRETERPATIPAKSEETPPKPAGPAPKTTAPDDAPPPSPGPAVVKPPADPVPVVVLSPAQRVWMMLTGHPEKLRGQTVPLVRPGLPDAMASIKEIRDKEMVLVSTVAGGGTVESRETIDSLSPASVVQMLHRANPVMTPEGLKSLTLWLSDRGDLESAWKELERSKPGGIDVKESTALLLERERTRIDGLKTPTERSAALKRLLATRSGLLDDDQKKALSPDSAGTDAPVGRTLAPKVQERHVLTGHAGEARAVTFSPDGKILATGGFDGTIRLWDVATGQPRGVLKQGAPLWRLAYTPDGKTLAATDFANKVKLWDPAAGSERLTYSGHSQQVVGLAISLDGTLVASASTDATARVWEISSGRERAVLKDHPLGAMCCAFSADGKTLYVGTADHQIQVWDWPGSALKATWTAHGQTIWHVATAPDGRSIVSSSKDGTVRIWDPAGKEKLLLKVPAGDPAGVNFSPDGRLIALMGREGTFRLLESSTGRELLSAPAHTDYGRCIVFSANGKSLATGGGSPAVKIFDVSGVGPTKP